MSVVVGVDRSTGSQAALRWAAAEAHARAEPLVVLHAYVRPLAYGAASAEELGTEPEHKEARRLLEELLAGEQSVLAGVETTGSVQPGSAAHRLIDAVDTADLLVVGSRGAGGFEGLLLGSTAEHCARHAPCPTVVVPPVSHARTRRIVVGVDGSEPAKLASAWAIREAALHRYGVDIISVYLPYRAHRPFGAEFMDVASPGWKRRLRAAAEAAADDALAGITLPDGVAVNRLVEAGHPARVLAQHSEQADLVVVGSRGLGGFTGLLLGSVSRQLLHHARCPVAVVRS